MSLSDQGVSSNDDLLSEADQSSEANAKQSNKRSLPDDTVISQDSHIAKRSKHEVADNKPGESLKFGQDESGVLQVAPTAIKLRHRGFALASVRPGNGEGVYPSGRVLDPSSALFSSALSSSSDSAADTLAAEIVRLSRALLAGHYTGKMHVEDARRAPTNGAQGKEKQERKRKEENSGAGESAGEDTSHTSLDPSKAPVQTLEGAFDIMAKKLDASQFAAACLPFAARGLRVVTMCSGTESPLLAMRLLDDALVRQRLPGLPVNHLASAEIEPFKQAYIQRNFEPAVLFRDVTEFIDNEGQAHTAFGGLADQPKDVHLLIAGSSCIDYSPLNNKRKTFGEDGSSYRTLMGVFEYAKRYQPSIVILENVSQAPWEKIRDLYNEAGYFSVVMLVDSKDFYIPQTRNRGYMVAFNVQRAQDIGLDLRKATKALVNFVTHLAQRASSPYTEFIYNDDDAVLKLARREIAESSVRNNIDWAACRLRYAAYRVEHGLGIERPLTEWKNGGKSQFSDYAWMNWARLQRERIFDTLDINYLAYLAQRHYDMTFKSRFIELSQNVDRDADSRHWGIVGCITPSGMPWDSRRGGPVFGKEALALQGIPVDKISFNRETSRQLQDLAGNAMTTTVVGAVIFSAVLASCVEVVAEADVSGKATKSMFQEYEPLPPDQTQLAVKQNSETNRALNTIEELSAGQNMVRISVKPYNDRNNVTAIKELAKLTLPVCACGDRTSSASQCISCEHTACSRCSGNPSHKYEKISAATLNACKQPEEFIQMITTALPPSLELRTSTNTLPLVQTILKTACDPKDHEIRPDNTEPGPLSTIQATEYEKAVVNALNCTVYLQAVKERSLWRIVYESEKARVELHFDVSGIRNSRRTSCMWLLYAKPSKEELSISAVRDILSHPIARMEPDDNHILKGKWQLWDPALKYAFLDIQGSGELKNSWEQKLGLQHEVFRELKVFSRLKVRLSKTGNKKLDNDEVATIKKVCGDFDWLEECGTACGSLYKRTTSILFQNGPKYFFLDPKPLQNAYLDRMVFAHTHKRLPYGVNRLTVGELQKAWRANSLTLGGDSATAMSVPCRMTDRWHDLTDMEFSGYSIQKQLTFWALPADTLLSLTEHCNTATPILLVELPTREIVQSQWVDGSQYNIALIDQPAALKDFQWMLKRFSSELSCTEGQVTWSEIIAECSTCAPHAPLLEWHYTRNKTGKKAVVKPFEDPEAATVYERALLSRNMPIIATVHADKNNAWLVVKLNLTTVVHRLRGKLILDAGNSSISWRLVYNSGFDAPPKFPSLKLSVEGKKKFMWPQSDLLYMNQQSVTKPKYFRQRTLWDTQRKALGWMLEVEKGIRWEEWDAEFCDAPALNLQLQVEATVKVSITGGIVADEVGAGKTTTSLALVARGLEDLPPQSNIPSSICPKKIRSRATLILVPNNILSQWKEEIEACFGKLWLRQRVVELKKATDKKDYTSNIQKLQTADIILAPWDILSQDEYWSKFGEVCCAPNVPRNGGRAFKQWLDEAILDLEDIVLNCGPNLAKNAFESHREAQKSKKKERYIRFEVFQGKNKKADKQQVDELKKEASEMKKSGPAWCPDAMTISDKEANEEFEALCAWAPTNGIPALLHFFHFQRLIVDEFTYPDARALLAIQKLTATHRWMLSGTPPITNAESINCMASMIGTKISCERETNLSFNFKDARSVSVSEKTYAEEFREEIEKRSPAWASKRNQRSEKFVNELIRQNEGNRVTVKQTTEYVVLPQSALEACIYNKAFQHITGDSLRFGVKKAEQANLNGEVRFLRALTRAETPEEALLSCHSSLLEHYSKKTDREAIGAFTDSLQKGVQELYQRLLTSLQEAFWYWNLGQAKADTIDTVPYFVTYLDCIVNRSYGDRSISDLLSRTAAYARKTPVMPEIAISSKNKDTINKDTIHQLEQRKKEVQARATRLNENSMALVQQTQQLRLLHNVRSIVDGQKRLPCSVCTKQKVVAEMTILGRCGHTVCSSCLTTNATASIGGCPTDGCSASAIDCRTPAIVYAGTTTASVSPFGTKMEAVLHKIRSIDKKEYILIFVQFEAHKKQLMRIFEEEGVGFSDGTKRADSSIRKFQNKANPKNRVLILQIDSADSAGWNLQVANHVMFITPFLSKTQYDYDATMTQAIGRAFRYGQKKDVKIYHFISTRTMDVNIIQARTNKKLVKKDKDGYGLVDVEDELFKDQEDLSGPSLDGDSNAAADGGADGGDGDAEAEE